MEPINRPADREEQEHYAMTARVQTYIEQNPGCQFDQDTPAGRKMHAAAHDLYVAGKIDWLGPNAARGRDVGWYLKGQIPPLTKTTRTDRERLDQMGRERASRSSRDVHEAPPDVQLAQQRIKPVSEPQTAEIDIAGMIEDAVAKAIGAAMPRPPFMAERLDQTSEPPRKSLVLPYAEDELPQRAFVPRDDGIVGKLGRQLELIEQRFDALVEELRRRGIIR